MLLTASRKQAPNLANSSLQVSFLTSVYVARMHFPYVAACCEHVVVDATASRRKGVVAAGDDCMDISV